MVGRLFAELIETATQEILRRHPDYFSYCEVEVPPIDMLAVECRKHPLFEQFSIDELGAGLVKGLQALDDLHVPMRRGLDHAADAISTMVLRSILDAYSASRGALDLRPPVKEVGSFENLLSVHYVVDETDSGIRYVLAKAEARPLLIISTTGAPLSIWGSLLADDEIKRRCLVVQSRGSPLLEGGTPGKSSLEQDIVDIEEVLMERDLYELDVVAWCNGARTAIALAGRAPNRVASLTLVAPTFHGIDPATYPSPFEDSLLSIHEMFMKFPDMGSYLMDSLTETRFDLSSLTFNRQKRIEDFLRLPPHAHLKTLLIPLSTVDFFRNYMDRVLRDQVYDIRTAISEVRCPILLLIGTHDAAINAQVARDILRKFGRDVIQATVFGAGHHIHLLQYPYFRFMLNSSLSRSPALGTMRVDVERLVG